MKADFHPQSSGAVRGGTVVPAGAQRMRSAQAVAKDQCVQVSEEPGPACLEGSG